jgi:mannose-1-phosphate guanylyltransferase
VAITPILLSGGGGTRLWPMSTPKCPKQFLALTGDQTMFQMTLGRVADRSRYTAPLIVAGQSHGDLIARQLAQSGISDAQIILEPCARNTAPAIALAALACDRNAKLLIMPSDHVINDNAAFQSVIDAAIPMVDNGWLVTFGISPTGPETGYGYIQSGDELVSGIYKVQKFVEKPNHESALQMVLSGDFVWNGGIFLFRADAFLDALSNFAPDILTATKKSMSLAQTQGNVICPDNDAFAASPSDSIDYAVMEKSDKVAVALANIGWSDIGSWDALIDYPDGGSDEFVMDLDGADNLFRSDGIRIHAVGVNGLIAVASGNDILILPRGKSQDVKKIVEALKAKTELL